MIKITLTNSEENALKTVLDVCTDKVPHLREDEILPLNEILWNIYKKIL